VAEWSNASVLKTEEAKVSVGSNPTPSVFRRSRVETFRGMRTQFEPEGRAADRRQAEQSEANPTPSVFRRSRVETFRGMRTQFEPLDGLPQATNSTPSDFRRSWPSGPLLFLVWRAGGWASRPYRGEGKVKKLCALGMGAQLERGFD